jgi:hypothetical protein
MTERDIDQMLRADGDRWRAAQPAPPEPDVERLLAAAGTGPDRRWQPLVAAAAVLAVVAGIVTVAGLRQPAKDGQVPVTGSGSGTDAVVRDGDLVVGQGEVVALPGRPVQLCPPRPVVALDIPNPPPPPPCEIAVTVVGLDLGKLSGRQERDGAVWGGARVEGVYRAGTLTVTRQEATVYPAPKDAAAADPVPCPEPSGGWPRQPDRALLEPALGRLQQVIRKNSTVFNDVYIRYPYGWHLQDQTNRKGTEVYVVGTVGDIAEARRMLEAVFPAEHLCVTRATWSMAEMNEAERQLRSAEARQAGVSDVRPEVLTDRVVAHLLVLDEAASRYLAAVAGGRVVAEPMLRRVG